MSLLHLCLLGDANSVHLQRWAREMMARGFRVSVVTARAQPIDGVEPFVLSPVRRSVDWLRRVGEARRFVERLAPDIVHAHYVSSYGYLAARCARHPLVMTAWGSDLLLTPRHSTLMRWLTGWTLRRADLITGDSLDLVAAAEARHDVAGRLAAAAGLQVPGASDAAPGDGWQGSPGDGGPVGAYSLQRVNERGFEVFTTQGNDYLMTGASGGNVTPNSALGGGRGGAPGIVNNIQVAAGMGRGEVLAATQIAMRSVEASIHNSLRAQRVIA